MPRRRKAIERGIEQFLPDEAEQRRVLDLVDLRDRLAHVEQQVLALYTAAAAYATIAKQHADEVRAEARSDRDRMQSTVIGLMERLRADTNGRLDAVESALSTTATTGTTGSRWAVLEAQVAAVTVALERAQRENQDLRMQIERLVERQMREEGWLASSGPLDSLSMR